MTRAAPVPRAWILLLGLASGLSAFGMASIVPAIPALVSVLHADFGALQFVVSAYLLGLGLAQPVQGVLSDRFGRRPVLLAGFAVFALASIAATFATSLAALVAARFVQALGVSVATVTSRAMVRDTHDAEQSAVTLAFITAVMGVAPIVGPVAGGAIVGLAGWRAIFVMHAAIALLLLAWMFFALRETRPAAVAQASFTGLFRGFGTLLRDRGFLSHAMLYGFSSGATFAFFTVAADLFEREFAVTPARFGLLWALLALAYTLGAWTAGYVARRRGAAWVLRTGMLIAIASAGACVVAALIPVPSLALYLFALVGQTGASGMTSPLALAGAVSERPEIAGVASGLSSSLAMLTSMVFAALSGALYTGTGLAPTLLLATGTALSWLAWRGTLRGARR